MWEGVPPGHSLMRRYKPGETRHYMGDKEGPPSSGCRRRGRRARPRRVSEEAGSRYRFGPRERGGALAGWRAGQIMTVAVGLVFGVIVLRWEPNAVGVAAAFGILVLYGALATVPVAGRTGDEWLPVVVCWGARRTGLWGARSHRAVYAGCASCAPTGGTWASCTTAPGERSPRRPVAARRELRAAGGRRAGPPGGRLGLGARLVGPRGLAGAPGAVGGGGLSRRRGGSALVSGCGGGAGRRLGLHRLLRRPAATTWTRTPAPTTSSWPCRCGSPVRSRSGAPRSPARSDRWSASWRTPMCRSSPSLSADELAHQLLRTYEPHATVPRRGRTTGRWPWRRAGPRCGWTAWCTPPSGWPNGPALKCAATSWRRSCSARPAPRSPS